MQRTDSARLADELQQFDMRPDGGVKTNWKTLIAVIGFAMLFGAAYYKLQDHDRRLAAIENKVDQTQQIAIEIRARLKP